MPETHVNLLELHPDRGILPPGIGMVLKSLNQDDAMLAFILELARMPADLDECGRKDFVLLLLALMVTLGQGHTRMPIHPGPGHPARILLEACGRPGLDLAAVLADPRLQGLVGGPFEARPLILDGGHLTTHRHRAVETGLGERVKTLLAQGVPACPVLPETVFLDPVPLNPQQRAAVLLAMEHPLALITGGPGTGKTSIVAALLRALLQTPDLELGSIALTAPTGKAAQRMGAALRIALGSLRTPGPVETALLEALPEPMTLHRLLAWHPALGRFRHHAGNPLAARVVIVDEASMVSQELLGRLFQALAPGARIILLGDAAQLPSVEGGSAFRDLLASLGGHAQRLTENYRMSPANAAGRNILGVAQSLQAPAAGWWKGPEPIQVLGALEHWQGAKVELLDPGEAGPRGFLEQWFRRVVLGLEAFPQLANRVYTQGPQGWGGPETRALQTLFEHFERFRILCALREASDLRGVEAVNQLLHEWMFAHTGAGLRRETPFFAGEPVLMTTNDYRRGLFNGDQGLVLKVAFQGELRQAAVFPGSEGFRAFPLDGLKAELELCYAMTVHKAQGSEYEQIAILLPRGDHPALTRELLYTAITRARKSVTLVGEAARVDWAAANATARDTGLEEALADAP